MPEGSTFTFNNGAEPQTLDPALMTGVAGMTVARELLEGLTRLHPRTLRPEPGVARSWDLSADGRQYTFHLRESRWSNGDPVTAHDFLYSWERVLNPETTGSSYAYMLFCLTGAREFNEGALADFGQVGARAEDDRTLVVTLERPMPYFLSLAAFATLYPVHRATVEKYGDRWTRAENIVGNGAFVMKSWFPHKEIVLEKNDSYWDAGNVALDRVRALAVEKAETGWMMYMRGETDWIRSIPMPRTDEAKKRSDYTAAPYFGTYFYRFNVTQKPLDDPRVRKALAMAIDRQSLCKNVLRAGQEPAFSHVPPMIEGYEGSAGFAYDPGAAREQLAAAGFPGGKGMRKITILYNTSEAHKKIAEVVQDMWKRELGIEVELVNQEWKVYLSSVTNMDYDVARGSWIGDYLDPNTFLDMFVTGGGNNRTGWSNERYDRLVEAAAATVDEQKRAGILREAERILVLEELPIIPLYFYVAEYLLRPGVEGFYSNPLNIHPLRSVRKVEQGGV